MKKTYINPEMEIVKIATQQMLASSDVDAHDSEPEEYGAPLLEGDEW